LDPISHGLLGASCTLSRRGPHWLLCGAVGGVAALVPDLDLLIRSSSDPVLTLEYHRAFSHSLVFSSAAAELLALAWYPWVGHRLRLVTLFALSWLGLVSHVLLDVCTTFGTELLWPFSNARIALSAVAVFDPLFTLPIGLLVLASVRRANSRYVHAALGWAVLYVAIGTLQHARAIHATERLATSRNHAPSRLVAIPSLGSVLLWKTIYEADGRFYVDGARLGFAGVVFPGADIATLDVREAFPELDPLSQQALDIERFREVAGGLVAVDPEHPARIIDLRYSLAPNEIAGFWAITVDPRAPLSAHVGFVTTRSQAPAEAVRLIRLFFFSRATLATAPRG
jgi:inner membrane protein